MHRHRLITLAALTALAASLALASACGGGAPGPSPTPSAQVTTGIVWQAFAPAGGGVPDSILVVAQEGVPSAFDRASITVTPSTVWRDVDGDRIAAPSIDRLAGRRIAVIITGPVRESYPVQADAASIRVLEPLDVYVNATLAGPPSLDGTLVDLVRGAGDALTAVRVRRDGGGEREIPLREDTEWLLQTPTELKPVTHVPLLGNGLEAPVTARIEAGEAAWLVLHLP